MEKLEDKYANFKVGRYTYKIYKELIPPNTYLDLLTKTLIGTNRDEKGNIIVSDDPNDIPTFEAIFNYLTRGIIPSTEYIDNFDYFGLNFIADFDLILFLENFMRDKMYHPEYSNFPFNVNPYHHLIKVDQEMWESLVIPKLFDENLLFNDIAINKYNWEYVQKSLHKLDEVLISDNIFIAGGRVFSALFGTEINDVDIFLHGLDSSEAKELIKKLYIVIASKYKNAENPSYWNKQASNMRKLKNSIEDNPNFIKNAILNTVNEEFKKKEYTKFHGDFYPPDVDFDAIYYNQNDKEIKITRSKNALTITLGTHDTMLDYQIIFRLYRTPSEILHGFDVDCCCMGYNKEGLWMTQRCLYSLTNGYNSVNFDRMSPSYEYRLAKYGIRGIPTKVPNFNRNNINIKNLHDKYKEITKHIGVIDFVDGRKIWKDSTETDYALIKNNTLENLNRNYENKRSNRLPEREKINGLDILILMEHLFKIKNYGTQTIRAITNLSKESSDYAYYPMSRSNSGERIIWMIEYLVSSAHEYPEYSEKYLKYLNPYYDPEAYIEKSPYISYKTNAFLFSNKIDHITYSPPYYQYPFIDILRYPEKFSGDPLLDILHHPENFDNSLLDIPEDIYKGFGIIRPWDIPQTIEFKIVNPGEQMTGTFHKLVLSDPKVWYQGKFYNY